MDIERERRETVPGILFGDIIIAAGPKGLESTSVQLDSRLVVKRLPPPPLKSLVKGRRLPCKQSLQLTKFSAAWLAFLTVAMLLSQDARPRDILGVCRCGGEEDGSVHARPRGVSHDPLAGPGIQPWGPACQQHPAHPVAQTLDVNRAARRASKHTVDTSVRGVAFLVLD